MGVNESPRPRGLQWNMDPAGVVTGIERTLCCPGQTAPAPVASKPRLRDEDGTSAGTCFP